MASGNRKERRAKESKSGGKSSGTSFQPGTVIDEDGIEMILKHPDYSGPKGKTLFEMADERQKELDKSKPTKWNLNTSAASSGGSPTDDEAAVGPVGDAILYATSMAALHMTLDVIVYSQYREDIIWGEIAWRAATALPIFMLLVYLTHVDFSYRFPMVRDIVFFVGAIVAGCYLVFSGNRHGYFYVMKAAPPVGALWIWSVVEMSLPFAAVSAISVFGYIWWNGFDFF